MQNVALCLAGLIIAACASRKPASTPEAVQQADTLRQGIAGHVWWIVGDQMPGPDRTPGKHPGEPVQREIYIYELTGPAQAQAKSSVPIGFYTRIETPRVAQTRSDAQGVFAVWLPPGRYSLLTKEPEGLYANVYDGEGHLQPVTVRADSVSQVTLRIDYEAAY